MNLTASQCKKAFIAMAIAAAFSLTACSTYQSKISPSRTLLKEGRHEEALVKLKELADKPGDDQLVYLMEYATALQMAGQYKESTRVFLEADKLADRNDYHSVSNVALATLGSEEMIQYKGESYEKILINVSLALNYVMMGEPDDALVEARRINEKIKKIRLDGRENYEQNPFANYLSGLLWESDQKYDDAYISYEGAYKIDGTNPFLPGDLIRISKKARRDEAHKAWLKEFPQIKEDLNWYDKNKGEIVLVIEQGWGPRRDFSRGNSLMPKLYPVPSLTQAVKAEVFASAQIPEALQVETSKVVYDVEQVSIRTLDADYAWMAARKVGAFVAKEVVADQIRQKNELLGLIAWVGMHASDRADLRQWSTLPQTIQLARFWVPPGTYYLKLHGITGSGVETGENREILALPVKAGHKSFYFWRPGR